MPKRNAQPTSFLSVDAKHLWAPRAPLWRTKRRRPRKQERQKQAKSSDPANPIAPLGQTSPQPHTHRNLDSRGGTTASLRRVVALCRHTHRPAAAIGGNGAGRGPTPRPPPSASDTAPQMPTGALRAFPFRGRPPHPHPRPAPSLAQQRWARADADKAQGRPPRRFAGRAKAPVNFRLDMTSGGGPADKAQRAKRRAPRNLPRQLTRTRRIMRRAIGVDNPFGHTGWRPTSASPDERGEGRGPRPPPSGRAIWATPPPRHAFPFVKDPLSF